MNNSKNRAAIHTAVASSQLGIKPIVNILAFDIAGAGLVRVTCSVNHAGDSRENHSKVTDALRAKLQGKMEAVAGSFTSLDNGQFQEHITGIVSVVKDAIPMTKQNLVGFKSVSANMFMDEEESMWVVRKSAAGDLIVKTTGIDDDLTLLKLMNQSVSSSSNSSINQFRTMVAQASSIAERVEGGQFVSYVNLNNEIAVGYVLASVVDEDSGETTQAIVLPVEGTEEEVISPKAVTEIHDQAEFPEHEVSEQEAVDSAVASARGQINLQTLLDYYKKVYARRPAFYQEFAKRIRSHIFA